MSKVFNNDVVANVLWQWINNNESTMREFKTAVVNAMVPHVQREAELAFLQQFGADKRDDLICDSIVGLQYAANGLEGILKTYAEGNCHKPGYKALAVHLDNIRLLVNQLDDRRARVLGRNPAIDAPSPAAPASTDGSNSSPFAAPEEIPF